MIAEGSGLPSMAKLGGWHVEYDKSNFSVVTHSQDTIDPAYVNNAKNYVSYMFITDDVQPNPYNTLPSHFDELLSLLDPSSSEGMHNLAVKSADLSGNPISGISIAVTSGSDAVTTDFTPLTYVSPPDTSFAVTPSDSGQYIFSHWENGSTSRTRTITLDSSKVITAYFRAESSTTLPSIMLINAMTQNGAELNMWATVGSNGNLVKTGFTPLTVTGTSGNSYTVTLSDYQTNMFNHWENGSTENSRTTVFSGYTFMTGFYGSESPEAIPKPAPILTINAVGLSGEARHMWTSIQSGGSTVETGYTPLSYSGTTGTSYTVTVRDYQDRVFDHWENGSTSRTRTITLDSSKVITAYFVAN